MVTSVVSFLCVLLAIAVCRTRGDSVEEDEDILAYIDCSEGICDPTYEPDEFNTAEIASNRLRRQVQSTETSHSDELPTEVPDYQASVYTLPFFTKCIEFANLLRNAEYTGTGFGSGTESTGRVYNENGYRVYENAEVIPTDAYPTEFSPDTRDYAGRSVSAICVNIASFFDEVILSSPDIQAAADELMRKLKEYRSTHKTGLQKRRSEGESVFDLLANEFEKLKIVMSGRSCASRICTTPQTTSVDSTTVEEVIAEEPGSDGLVAAQSTEKSVPLDSPIVHVIPEDDSPGFVGSVRGIPGVHFPNYDEIPITSFSCSDKFIPGFYADMDTGCQVFHVCYEHRRESFLCPVGTIFNQPILACDYWYSSNCSQAQIYYDVNARTEDVVNVSKEEESDIEKLLTTIIEKKDVPKEHKIKDPVKKDIAKIAKFLPVKAKIVEFPLVPKPKAQPAEDIDETAAKIFEGILFTGTKVVEKAKEAMEVMSGNKKVVPVVKPLKSKLAVKTVSAIPIAKAKLVSAAIVPVAKAKIVSAAAVPVAKAKIVSAAAPVVKTKLVTAAAVPVIKAKFATAAAVPIKKAKIASTIAIPKVKSKLAALPLAKAKYAAASVPVLKAQAKVPFVKLAAIKPKFVVAPLKMKAAAGVPIFKAKALAISPLTKKALALGYMKLLKAKKLALMG